MKSPTSIHPTSDQVHRLGLSDVELMRRYAALADDDLPTVLTYARRRRDEAVAEIAEDAAPQLISDDEPTVPVNRRRIAGLRAGVRPVG
jgi:hypothetical protein